MPLTRIMGEKFRYELSGTSQPFDYLVHRNLTNEKELKKIQETSHDNKQIVQRLTSEHRIVDEDLGNSLSVYYKVPYLPYLPDKYHLYQSESKLNLSYLKRNFVAVLADVKGNLILFMAEPNNATLLMEIERALGIDSYEISLSFPNNILQYLGEVAGGGPGAMDEILDEIGTSTDELDDQTDEMSDDAPAVVRLVSRVLHDAKRLNASDIHVAPEKNAPTRIRMRIDVVCRDITPVLASHHSAVIARIKIMSDLNIAEKRVPKDGKLSFRMSGQLIEVRVATIPTVAGEGGVMRILASGDALPMSKMNLSVRNTLMIEDMIKKPHPIILVVGPTGSGKTTTLHAILDYISTPEKKI
jgi:type II secretory ATPase GspE/PulE/Tfp pilus assembly ATPase PilB-like protein